MSRIEDGGAVEAGLEISADDIERMARALCDLDGEDPDREIIGGQAQAFENYGPAWSAGGRCLGFPDYVAQARAALSNSSQAEGQTP